jgi:VanZ family protein
MISNTFNPLNLRQYINLFIRHFNRALFWGFLLFVSYKFIAPAGHSGINIPHLDKIVHAGIFFVLTFLLIRAHQMAHWQYVITLAIYGALIEYLQGLTGFRSSDVYDWIADCLGIFILLVSFHLFPLIKPIHYKNIRS